MGSGGAGACGGLSCRFPKSKLPPAPQSYAPVLGPEHGQSEHAYKENVSDTSANIANMHHGILASCFQHPAHAPVYLSFMSQQPLYKVVKARCCMGNKNGDDSKFLTFSIFTPASTSFLFLNAGGQPLRQFILWFSHMPGEAPVLLY